MREFNIEFLRDDVGFAVRRDKVFCVGSVVKDESTNMFKFNVRNDYGISATLNFNTEEAATEAQADMLFFATEMMLRHQKMQQGCSGGCSDCGGCSTESSK